MRRIDGEERDVPESVLVELADELFCTLDQEETDHSPPLAAIRRPDRSEGDDSTSAPENRWNAVTGTA